MTNLEKAQAIIKVLDEKKAENIMLIKTEDKTIIADYFVIATGTSTTHVKSLCDEVEFRLGEKNIIALHIEGRSTGWILLDFNDVLLHVFTKDQREFYDIERLWSDAEVIDISDILTED